eukprot:SAG31_NODE_149_length_22476_cov_41.827189_10_plen_1989_part_00
MSPELADVDPSTAEKLAPSLEQQKPVMGDMNEVSLNSKSVSPISHEDDATLLRSGRSEEAAPLPQHVETIDLHASTAGQDSADNVDGDTPTPPASPASSVASEDRLIMPTSAQRKRAFQRWDTNGNGALSLAEIDKAVVELFPEFDHKPVLMRAYKAADKSGDGLIERREFDKLLHYMVYFNDLWGKFQLLDKDGDRRLTLDEFISNAPSLVGHHMSAAEAVSEFTAMDSNGGGVILFDEFCRWCASRHVVANRCELAGQEDEDNENTAGKQAIAVDERIKDMANKLGWSFEKLDQELAALLDDKHSLVAKMQDELLSPTTERAIASVVVPTAAPPSRRHSRRQGASNIFLDHTDNAQNARLSMSGALRCQFRGKGKFVPVWVHLSSGGVLTFQKSKEEEASLCTGVVDDCVVGLPTSTRKGHPHAVRVDLAKDDSNGNNKYVFSVDSPLLAQEWLQALASFTVLNADEMAAMIRKRDREEAELRGKGVASQLSSIFPKKPGQTIIQKSDTAIGKQGRPLSSVIPKLSDAWKIVTMSVKRVHFFSAIPDEELDEVARSLELVEFKAGEIIVNEGATSEDGMYIVWEGTAQAEKDGEPVHSYKSGDHFGELALLGVNNNKGGRRGATVRATGGHSQAQHVTHCLRLAIERFHKLSSVAPTMATVLAHRAVEPTSPPASSPPRSEVSIITAGDDISEIPHLLPESKCIDLMSTSGSPGAAPRPMHSGPIQCQWKGKGNFVQVWAELSSFGRLSFWHNRNQGAPLRTADVSACAVGLLNSQRKGHTYAFRLDLANEDSTGESKYVISSGSALQAQEWVHCLVAHSVMDDITLTQILNSIASAQPEESPRARGPPRSNNMGSRRVFTLSIMASKIVDSSMIVVTASVLAELEVRVQEQLHIPHRIRLQQLHQASGQLLDVKDIEFLPTRCTVNVRKSLKAHEQSVKERVMILKEEQLVALENEEYEECGRLRDEIRRLESTILGGNARARKKIHGPEDIDAKEAALDKAIEAFDRLSRPVSTRRDLDSIIATRTISPVSPRVSIPEARPEGKLTPLQRRQRTRVAAAINQIQRNLRSQSYDHQGQSLEKLFCLYDSRRLGLLKFDEFRSAVRKGGRVTQQQLNDGELKQLFQSTCGSEDPQSITRKDLEGLVWGNKEAVLRYAERVIVGVDGVGNPKIRGKKKKRTGRELKAIEADSLERHRNRLGSPQRRNATRAISPPIFDKQRNSGRRSARPAPALTVGDVAGQHNRHAHLRDHFYGTRVDRIGHRSRRIRALVSPTRERVTRPNTRHSDTMTTNARQNSSSSPPSYDQQRRKSHSMNDHALPSRHYRALVSPPRRRPLRACSTENDPWLKKLEKYTKKHEARHYEWQQRQEQKQLDEALQAQQHLNKSIHSKRLSREAADRMIDRLSTKRCSVKTQDLAKQLRDEEDRALLTLHNKKEPLTVEQAEELRTRLHNQGTVEPRSARTGIAHYERINRRQPVGPEAQETRWHGVGKTVNSKSFAERQQAAIAVAQQRQQERAAQLQKEQCSFVPKISRSPNHRRSSTPQPMRADSPTKKDGLRAGSAGVAVPGSEVPVATLRKVRKRPQKPNGNTRHNSRNSTGELVKPSVNGALVADLGKEVGKAIDSTEAWAQAYAESSPALPAVDYISKTSSPEGADEESVRPETDQLDCQMPESPDDDAAGSVLVKTDPAALQTGHEEGAQPNATGEDTDPDKHDESESEALESDTVAALPEEPTMKGRGSNRRRFSVSLRPGEMDQFVQQIEAEEDQVTDGVEKLSVFCPDGCGPGDPLYVTTPSGQEVEVIVPDGVNPGDAFEVEVEIGPSTSVVEQPIVEMSHAAGRVETLETLQDDESESEALESDTVAALPEKSTMKGRGSNRRRFSVSLRPGEMDQFVQQIEAEEDQVTDGVETLSVFCPDGCGPGDPLYVTTPSGQEVEVIVPDGVNPGDAFEVEVEIGPSTGAEHAHTTSIDEIDSVVLKELRDLGVEP